MPARKRDVDSELDTMRHSAAHVMAAAVQRLWPNAKFGVGPATRNGFFYDIDLDVSITPEDLPRIEAEMRRIQKSRIPFRREDVPIDQAIDAMRDAGQPYKVELLSLLKEKGSTAVVKETGDDAVADTASGDGVDAVSFYRTGDFVDLCRGPHVADTGQIGAFKLVNIAGAYWRGNEKNRQLQRVYGFCFRTKEDVERSLWQMEEAKRRDHRRIGREMEIFLFSEDVGAGLPLWLPNGTVLRKELEKLATEEERKDGYLPVSTPVLTKENLYYRSGHLPYYKDDMYAPIDIEGENYYLKPMNCPHHHLIYGARPRSYRELPLRLTEYGHCHRYEASGALSGLMRVRSFYQNDAHIYCTFDQAKDEFMRVMRLHSRYYELLGIRDYFMRFSLPDLNKLDKYVDAPEKWLAAMDIVRAAMQESGYPYEEMEGDAAFYGPKIDFIIESAVGNEYAISTNQLDFLATERFNLRYIGEDGREYPLYVIHRAPLGSHERFVAFLIEHFGGHFPLWLAPIQVRIVPIADRHNAYAETIRDRIFSANIETATGGARVDADFSAERMQKKIRNAQLMRIPYMLIVGDAEQASGEVAVRTRSGQDLGKTPLDSFLDRLKTEIALRQNAPQ